MPEQAQGGELGFAFQNALRIIVVELPDEFVQGAVALFFGQGEQDVADVFGVLPVGKVEFVQSAGGFLELIKIKSRQGGEPQGV